MRKKTLVLLILDLILLAIVALLITTGHAATSAPRPNTLGVPQFYNNPYAYLLALPMDGQILEGKYTNIRFAPYAASDMYDFSLLFCGDVTEEFEGKPGVVVVTYRIQASRAYKGIPCHDLIRVFEVTIK